MSSVYIKGIRHSKGRLSKRDRCSQKICLTLQLVCSLFLMHPLPPTARTSLPVSCFCSCFLLYILVIQGHCLTFFNLFFLDTLLLTFPCFVDHYPHVWHLVFLIICLLYPFSSVFLRYLMQRWFYSLSFQAFQLSHSLHGRSQLWPLLVTLLSFRLTNRCIQNLNKEFSSTPLSCIRISAISVYALWTASVLC